MRRACPPALLLLLLVLGSACELTERVVAPGEPTVIVQAVVSRTRPEQYVTVEYSRTGAQGAAFRTAINGAVVTLAYPGSACVPAIDTLRELNELVLPDSVIVRSGRYRTSVPCSHPPGQRLQLRVVTPAGEVVTGTLTVPGAAAYHVGAGGVEAAPFSEMTLDRVTDTLRIALDPLVARAMQVEVRAAEDHETIALYAFFDTLGVSLPGNLVNPFEGDSGEAVFGPGRYYDLTVAAMDSNYYDFVRSFSDPLTGRGFLNHLDGGVGVFGAVEAQQWRLRVTGPQTDPREGRYRLTGSFGGDPVDLELDVYLEPLATSDVWAMYAAFIDGSLAGGTVRRSGQGYFVVDGPDRGLMVFQFTLPDGPGLQFYQFMGFPAPGGAPFEVRFDGAGLGSETLTMERLP